MDLTGIEAIGIDRERTQALRFVCSDMWKPYLKVVVKKAGHALHVLDRFHIAMHLSKAIDEVRAQEARALKRQGRHPLLTRTRWLLLKRPEHRTATEATRLVQPCTTHRGSQPSPTSCSLARSARQSRAAPQGSMIWSPLKYRR